MSDHERVDQDVLDLASIAHTHAPQFWSGSTYRCETCARLVDEAGCLPYRLAALALDLQGKVARVEAELHHAEDNEHMVSGQGFTRPVPGLAISYVRAALADRPDQVSA